MPVQRCHRVPAVRTGRLALSNMKPLNSTLVLFLCAMNSFVVLVVRVDDLLYLVLRAQEDTAPVVNVFRNHLQKTLHLGVHCQTACVLKEHSHGSTLVEDTQLALAALGISRVGENTAVEESPVGIGHHATNITRAVGLLALAGVLQRVEVLVHPVIPVHAVTLVDRVDGPLGRKLHVGVCQDELTQRVLHGEAVDTTVAHGDHQLCGGTVHGEAGGHHLRAGAEKVLGSDLVVGTKDLIGKLEDSEDGTNRNASVKVGGTVNRVADHGIAGVGVLVEDNGLLLFLGNKDTALAGALHGGDKNIIADDVKLLLIIASRVRGTSQTGQVNQGSATNVVGNRLECELKSVAE